MAADFGDLKPTPTQDESKMQPVKVADRKPVNKKPAAWKKYPFLVKWVTGLEDVHVVVAEHKYSLFIKQFVVLLVVFLAVRFLCGQLNSHREELFDRMSALKIQQTNKEDYLANKQHLLELEPIFPDIANKNEWLLRHLVDFFKKRKITPDIDGNVVEKAQDEYVVLRQTAKLQQSFPETGKLLADIENGDDFLRISNLRISKITEAGALGKNAVTIEFNTLFPREKYGPRLFKDYSQQMAKMKAAREAAKAQPAAAQQTQGAAK